MLSAHGLPNTDVDYYRKVERGVSLALGQSHSLSEQYDHSSLTRRESPVPEAETKTSGSHRKRVPVACERCRKRKIKCSGDEGGANGCVNCRNAGHSGCQFLRVQSFNTSTVNPSSLSSSRSWPSTRYHPYACGSQRAVHQTTSPQPQLQANSIAYPVWHNGLDYAAYSNSGQSCSWTRAPYTHSYSLGYDAEASSPYSTTPPAYMLPDPDQGSSVNTNYMQPISRSQQGPIWLEQISNGSISQVTTPTTPSGYSANTGETQPAYPEMSAVTTDLSRTLPDPAIVRRVPVMTKMTNMSEDASSQDALGHSASIGWHAEIASNASISSSQASSKDRHDSMNSYANSACASQDLAYGYTTISHSPQKTMISASSPSGGELLRSQSTIMVPDLSTSIRGSYQQKSVDELKASATNASVIYGYASPALHGRRSNTEYNSRSLTTGATYWPSVRHANHVKNITTRVSESHSPDSQRYATSNRGSTASLVDPTSY